MRFCDHCSASLEGMRPSARTCSAACRRAVSRSAADTLAARDAAAAALLLRERQALEALESAASPEERAAASEELARIGDYVDRLFTAHG
ncbi:hypothetical protein EDF21_0672 [Frigoribacterium sp. PhB118]|nr:hypothetical protein EDF21_0672 [Frigoribacterium sp. PhB118]